MKIKIDKVKIEMWMLVIIIFLTGIIALNIINNYQSQKALNLNQTIKNATVNGFNQALWYVYSTSNIPIFSNSSGNWTFVKFVQFQELCGR